MRGPERRKLELGRHHSHHRVSLAVERNRRAHHAGIAAKSPLPQFIAEDDLTVRARLVFSLDKKAAQQRLDAEHRQQVLRHPQARKMLGYVAARDVRAPVLRRRHRLEGTALIAPVDIVGDRHRIAAIVQKRNQPVRIFVSQRAE